MAKSRNAKQRAHVLAEIGLVMRSARLIVARWSVRSQLYDTAREGRNAVLRDRRQDEYPENNAQEWERLAVALGRMIRALENLREYARARAQGLDADPEDVDHAED